MVPSDHPATPPEGYAEIEHSGDSGCGGVAFWYLDPLPVGTILAGNVMYPSGREARAGDEIICDSCGEVCFGGWPFENVCLTIRWESLS